MLQVPDRPNEEGLPQPALPAQQGSGTGEDLNTPDGAAGSAPERRRSHSRSGGADPAGEPSADDPAGREFAGSAEPLPPPLSGFGLAPRPPRARRLVRGA